MFMSLFRSLSLQSAFFLTNNILYYDCQFSIIALYWPLWLLAFKLCTCVHVHVCMFAVLVVIIFILIWLDRSHIWLLV